MTQLEAAKKKIITEEMKQVAADENIDQKKICKLIARGLVVIPANKNHKNRKYFGIGKYLRIKINANIGTAPQNTDINKELEKLKVIEELKTESVMDLSIAGDLDKIRTTIIKNSKIMVGTVPIYQILTENKNNIEKIDLAEILETIKKHGEQGVDFITVHCGLTRKALPFLKQRVMGIVSRGGSFIASWMQKHNKENPLYTHYDEILKIARKYDMTISLGDGLRPGALADATDAAQLIELKILGKLAKRAQKAGVQVMIEGPGHVPFNQIKYNMKIQQKLCKNAPFYVLGPLTTDKAPGYDHIAGAIGGTLAAYHGASFLCYVTPAEHLRLPSIEDVREGVVASKIAAHSADIALGNKQAINEDYNYAKMRHDFNWEGMFRNAIDPVKPIKYRKESTNYNTEECSMCGDFCALKMLEKEKNIK